MFVRETLIGDLSVLKQKQPDTTNNTIILNNIKFSNWSVSILYALSY